MENQKKHHLHNERLGFEIKRSSSARITPSMRSALTDLKLQRIYVVHPWNETFPMSEDVSAVGISRILEDLKPL